MVAVFFLFSPLSLLLGRISAFGESLTHRSFMGTPHYVRMGFLYLRYAWHDEVLSLNFSVESRKALNTCIFNNVYFE
jgi:hypothetical protein